MKAQQERDMSFERPTPDQPPANWKIEKTVFESHIEIRITPEGGESASEKIHVTQVRKLALGVLAQLGITQRTDEIALIVNEFTANCIEHGDGIREVDLDLLQSEVLRVRTVNGVREGGARLVPEQRRGELINTQGNDEAEGGRGIMLAHALADAWGQSMVGDTVVTYADFHIQPSGDHPAPPSKAA